MLRWYAVQTHARAEEKALFNLRRQGFESYLPQYLKRRRHARRVDWVPAPLFPGYLFVGMDAATTRWRAIRSTFGVAQIVCQGNAPTPLPDGVVDEIRSREDGEGLVVLARKESLKKGQRVEIARGPLDALSGIFERIDAKERVIILLELMGRQIRARLPLEAVRA